MSEDKEKISPTKMIKQAQKTKGYMLKKSRGIMGGWNQRYFLILNGALSYYNDQALDKLKGEIKLKEIKSISMKGNSQFALSTPKKQYEFRCNNQADRDLWVASLNLLKQYINDEDFTKKFLIKKSNSDRKIGAFQICNINDVRHVLSLMKLNILVEQLEESRIHQRIYCQKLQNQFYIIISIKCLDFPQIDEEILDEKYVYPYNFNKFYRVQPNGIIQDVSKMSQMHSLKTNQNKIILTFADKKKILIPFKNQAQAYQISRRICRCYQIAKQYYNPFKIVMKKNVDKLVYIYDNFQHLFEDQIHYRIRQNMQKYTKTTVDSVNIFINQFTLIRKDLVQTDEACKIMNPPRDDVKFAYFKMAHEQIKKQLSIAWQNLYEVFEPPNMIKLSAQLYEYFISVNQYVQDSNILQGCFDMNKFFIARISQPIKQKIHSFDTQKIEYKKNKNLPLTNQLTSAFYSWLKQALVYINQAIPIEPILNQFGDFYVKIFDEFLDYLSQSSQKWNQILLLIGACNDLSRIRALFKESYNLDLYKSSASFKQSAKNCVNEIVKKINQTLGNLIKRIFLFVFRTIDRKLLAKPFLQISFAKICYEVLQRLEPYKTKVLQEIEYQLIIMSFDQICFFLYTTYINKNIPNIKYLRDYYIKAVEKGTTQIQQYYCNIKTQNYVKKYLKQLLQLKQVLSCTESQLINCCNKLYHTFESSFNEESIETILMIRQTNPQYMQKLAKQCFNALVKTPSSEDNEQTIIDIPLRSRKSTLSESVYALSIPETIISVKATKQGFLQFKKVLKGVPNFYSKSYFKICKDKLLQFASPNQNQVLSTIDLLEIDNCYLDQRGIEKNIFLISIGASQFYFKANNRDEAGQWIQAIYSQIKIPLFENKNQFCQKQKGNAIFKNFQCELATTATNNKWKNLEIIDNQKIFQNKRKRRLEGIREQAKNKQSQRTSSSSESDKVKEEEIKNSPNLQKKQKQSIKKKYSQRESEGSCCTTNMF